MSIFDKFNSNPFSTTDKQVVLLPQRETFFPKQGSYLTNETDYWYLIDQLNRVIPQYFEKYKTKNLRQEIPFSEPLGVGATIEDQNEYNALNLLRSQIQAENQKIYSDWLNKIISPSELQAFKKWQVDQSTSNWYDNIMSDGFFPQVTSQIDSFFDESPLAQILAPQVIITNESLKHPVETTVVVASAAIASGALAGTEVISGAATSEGALLGQTGLLSETAPLATFANPIPITAPLVTTGVTISEVVGWTGFITEASDFLLETNQFLASPIGGLLLDNASDLINRDEFTPSKNYSSSQDNDLFFIIILGIFSTILLLI